MIAEKEENGKENGNRCGVQTVPGLCFLKWKDPLVGVYSNAYAQAISRVGTVSTLQINSPCKPDNMFISAPFVPMLLWHVVFRPIIFRYFYNCTYSGTFLITFYKFNRFYVEIVDAYSLTWKELKFRFINFLVFIFIWWRNCVFEEIYCRFMLSFHC